MVGHAADFQRGHFVLTRDAAEKRPETFLQFGRDERTPFFGAEHAMKIGADVGHALDFQPLLRGLSICNSNPAVETVGYFRFVPAGRVRHSEIIRPIQRTFANK